MSYGPGFVATVAATLPTQTSAERPTSTGARPGRSALQEVHQVAEGAALPATPSPHRTPGGSAMTQSTDKKSATFVKQRNGNGEGRVYRLDPPLTYSRHDFNSDGDYVEQEHTTEHVWVSAADVVFSGPETYIFPSDADGNVTSWLELHGSFRGDLDHEQALANAGYEVAS